MRKSHKACRFERDWLACLVTYSTQATGPAHASQSTSGRFSLPSLVSMALRNFTLFPRDREIEIDLTSGVTCIAGANGLGKSTLIAAANFCLTGIVAPPDREYRSADEYYRFSRDFALNYFDGRIAESDRQSAEIELVLRVGSTSCKLVRGMFEPEELRVFETSEGDAAPSPSVSPADNDTRYRAWITSKIGLSSFGQFVFLQHFVLSFDERRHLLLWHERTLEECLHIAFGIAPESQEEASSHRRRADRQDSVARNKGFQARGLLERIGSYEKLLLKQEKTDPATLLPLKEQHETLLLALDEAQKHAEMRREKLEDSQTQLANALSTQEAIRSEYEANLLDAVLQKEGNPGISPESLKDLDNCPLCGGESAFLEGALREAMDKGICPVCRSQLAAAETSGEQQPSEQGLKSLAAKLKEARIVVEECEARANRRQEEAEEATEALRVAQDALSSFEEEEPELVTFESAGKSKVVDAAINEQIQELQVERERLMDEKKQAYARRDEARASLRKIQTAVESSYQLAAPLFVPTFTELSSMFLGLDLDIHVELEKPAKLALHVRVEGSPRREAFQLSESQRFFLDIAFRMALIEYLKTPDSQPTLSIDTPEGALDIAYEARAGLMFSRFANLMNHLLITANINTSHLLLTLAKQCGADTMHLVRMTGWAALSEVQLAEESRFDEAMDAITVALGKKGVD